MADRACIYCNSTADLRPYGPNAAWVCFGCGMKPEHRAETDRQFSAQLAAAGPIAVIGEETGPRPMEASNG